MSLPVARGARLRIVIKNSAERAIIELYDSAGQKKGQVESQPWNRITAFRDDLAATLYSLVRKTDDILTITDFDRLDDAINNLDSTGMSLTYDLLGPNGDKVLRGFLRAHLPQLFLDEPRVTNTAPLIEIESVDDFVPFEILPLVGPPDTSKVKDVRSLRRAMSRYLGMAAVIRRIDQRHDSERDSRDDPILGLDQDRILLNDDKLPIKFFHDSNLDGAKAELDFFARVGNYIDLDGPWPTADITKDNAVEKLAAALLHPRQMLSGCKRDPGDQIHHFSCHFDAFKENVMEYYFTLRSNEIGPFAVNVRGLKAALLRLGRGDPRLLEPDMPKPLIFANACGSGVDSPKHLLSLPRMLDYTHRGMIGTETKIPDPVAAEFAETFYSCLLFGQSVGDSVQEARWTLVDIHCNPLGLLYTLHADPDLRTATAPFI
jgi:hypothetical protein